MNDNPVPGDNHLPFGSEVGAEAEMPNPKVEFVAVLDDTDDEIEVIPYVKPPPVVIEIVESDPENDSTTGEKKKKRKSKKKKSKREKERECSTDDASHITEPSLSSTANSQIDSTPTNNAYDNELSTGQNVEPEATSSGYSSSSGNVAVVSSSSVYDFVDETEEIPLNTIGTTQGLSGSYLEANDYTRSFNREGTSVVTEAVMVGTTAHNQNDKDPKEKRSKEKKNRGEGKPRTRKISATQRTNEEIVNFLTTLGIPMETSAFESPPAKRRRQPTKKSRSGASDGGATDSDSVNTGGDGTINNNDVHNIEEQQLEQQSSISEAENVVQGSFVAVTQESNKASKNSPRKGKRQRTAIVGDISDFQVSFTKGELNSLNTNFQSNVVFTTSDNDANRPEDSSVESRISSYNAVIDAVARSGIVETELRNLEESSTKAHQPSMFATSVVLTNDMGSNVNDDLSSNLKDVEQSSRILQEDTPSTSGLQQVNVTQSSRNDEDIRTTETLNKVLDSTSPSITDKQLNSDPSRIEGTETDKSSKSVKRKDSSRDSLTKPTMDSQGECSSNISKKNSHGQEETIQLTTKRQKSGCDVNLNIRNTNTTATVSNATTTGTQELHQEHIPTFQELPQGQATTCTDIVPYFPTTWTSHMKDFYGSSQNEDFELDEALDQLSDAPGKWRALRDLMPPPKNKSRYVRCDNCKQMGHFKKQCTENRKPPCCHMCGLEGHTSDHNSRRPCIEAKCLNCGRKQVQYSQRCSSCLLRRDPRKCEICNVIGHDKTVCPDNWRPFHVITSVEEYEKAKPIVDNHSRRSSNYYKNSPDYKRKSAMFCSNCGRKGHSYYDCYQGRFNPYHRNKPFVIRDVPVTPIVSFLGSNTNIIPISYDARTGRTVVMNKEPNAPPEIAVETIQVKITNELAVTSRTRTRDVQNQNASATVVSSQREESEAISDEIVVTAANKSMETTPAAVNSGDSDCLKEDSIPVVCNQHEKCTNSPKTNDQCRQTILQKQSYKTLQKAREDGLLKIIEEKHEVQISLIDDNNRFHICGENVGEAQKDVCRILWSKENSNHLAMVFNDEKIRIINAKAAKSNPDLSKTHEASGSHVKMEIDAAPIPNDNKTQEVENLSGQRSRGWTSLKNPENVVQVVTVDDDDEDCCVIEELPAGTSKSTESARSSSAIASMAKAKCTESSEKDQTSASSIPVTTNESRTPSRRSSQQTVAAGRANSGDSFLRYESPLAGLTLGNPSPPIMDAPTMSNEDNPILYIPLQGKSADDFQVLDSQKIYGSIESIPRGLNASTQNKSAPENSTTGVNECLPSTSNNNNTTNASTTDKEKISAIEIITLEDDDEEKVTLLQSEWNLVMSHSVRSDNIINQISSRFDVDLVISKEVSSISISNGTKENRKIAKDNIVFWLECQSSNSEFRILPSGYNQLTGTPKLKKQNKKLKRIGQGSSTPVNPQFKRALKLTDAHPLTPRSRKRSPKKKHAKHWKKKNQNNPNMIHVGHQHQPLTPSQNCTPNGSSGTPIMGPWGPGSNFDNTSLPLQSASPADLGSPSPRKVFRNNSPQGGNGSTPRSRFNFHPRKPRYYHT